VRFHLIDRIDDCEPGRSVRARKLTSRGETYWRGSAGAERMPEPLVLEALCQAGTWLVLITTDRRRRAALLSVDAVRFAAPVTPGDVLVMEAEVVTMSDESAVISGRVTVDGATVLEADNVMCALIEADRLEDLDATERMQAMLTGTAA
jgi:3-hydroxyacyl-[acyl-carrier-protein] dehydratase